VRRIKVCHFASVHTTTDTRVFHRECTSLARHFDVTLIAIGNTSGIFNDVNVIAIPRPQNRIHRLLFTTWVVFFKAWKQHADIYHIHDAELIPFAMLLRVLRGKKVIYDIHENTYEDILHKPWIPRPLKWIMGKGYRFLEWLSSKLMHTILVIAEPGFAKRFLTSKYSIIQNFADYNLFAPFQKENRSQIEGTNLFYMGTVFDYYYSLVPVVDAIAILKERGVLIQFHCAGYTGRYIDDVLSKTKAYAQVKDQLHFYGYLNIEQGYEISKQCKVGLCLKNQPESILVSHERKFFEYMAVGMPVLSCNSHIYRDIIDKYKLGKYTNISDAKAIADTLEEMMQNGTALDTYAKNNINAAKNFFNWKTEEVKLLGCYNIMGLSIPKKATD
jgi:glycosyltransferase involved in cell wall biosynthesis